MNRYNLERFVAAQDNSVYERVLAELRAGYKVSHWMWFVFPQIAGLGRSPTARKYAISALPEARAYLQHSVLGPRLSESAGILTSLDIRSAPRIFGTIDAQKLQSSMTLFLRADPEEQVFQRVLDQYFNGMVDTATDELLEVSEQ